MPKLIGTWNQARGVWETDTLDLLSAHSEPYSATWPTSGMTRSGAAYELQTPALHMAGSASSSLPTPRASRGASGTATMYALGAERSDAERTQGEVVLPTPLASDGEKTSRTYARGNPTLRGTLETLRPTPMTLLKTPLSNLGQNGGSQHPDKRKAGGHGPTLADEVEHLLPPQTVFPNGEMLDGHQLLPTPAAHDSGNTPENHLRKKPGRAVVTSLQVLVDHDLIATGGRIVPPSSAGSASPDD
ncbi:hypothetical protein J2X60_002975 [Curtobacterium sp. 320]|nr:hypothetical protein [Curtobacterium sp. 320]